MRNARNVISHLGERGVKRVGALKSLSPIFLALIRRPGAAANDGEMLEAAQTLRKETERVTDELVALLEVEDSNDAVRARVGEVVSSCVASEWIAAGDKLDMGPYHPVWGYVAESDVGADLLGIGFDDALDGVELRLALVSAMTEVVARTRRAYLMRQNPDQLYPRVMASLVRVAASGVDAIAGSDAKKAQKMSVMGVLIAHCADMFCAHWDKVARAKVVELLAMSPEDRVAVYGQNPGGFALDEVFDGYRNDFRSLVAGVSRFRFDFSQEPSVALDEGV